MNERFRVVVRWAALILLGAAAGGLAAWLGAGTIAELVGGVLLFVCAVIVGATTWTTYLPLDGDRSNRLDELVGPNLFRAVSLGFFGAGVLVGALTIGANVAAATAAAAGLIVLLLTRSSETSESP